MSFDCLYVLCWQCLAALEGFYALQKWACMSSVYTALYRGVQPSGWGLILSILTNLTLHKTDLTVLLHIGDISGKMSRMSDASGPNFGTLRPLQAAISNTCEEIGSRWQTLYREFEHHKREIQNNAASFVSHVGHVAGSHLRRIQESQQRQQTLAGLAVSTNSLCKSRNKQSVHGDFQIG